ncbi:MAG: homing endonuclease associated repeat-containing protein, partial [Haloarculaceae archaeon]
ECLAALREAAERLGDSPTKAEYEELGMRPASATIIRVVGGWNEAKEEAGLDTAPSTGTRVAPQPDDVTLPEGTEWEDLSVDQRWHYRNVEHNTERTLARRRRLRAWANGRKRERGCRNCGETDPACLDFHHVDATTKEMAMTEMITYGYGREKLREEMTKCTVLCTNCHRIEHHGDGDVGGGPGTESSSLQTWVYEYKATAGCAQCGRSDPRCLVCHHDGEEKRATVAQLVSDGRPRDEIETELDRCVILCANCHRKEHVTLPRENGESTEQLRQS